MVKNIVYKQADSDKELRQILNLQRKNLSQNLTQEQINSQGFVTVNHDYSVLSKMNNLEKCIIAKSNTGKSENEVIAYLLAMRSELRNDVPVLVPMFDVFDKLIHKNKKLNEYNYIVVGQVCVAEGFRGQGILDDCYAEYKRLLSPKYDFALTEIDSKNQRSINAHRRIGFELLHNYTSPDNQIWDIIIWDWNKK